MVFEVGFLELKCIVSGCVPDKAKTLAHNCGCPNEGKHGENDTDKGEHDLHMYTLSQKRFTLAFTTHKKLVSASVIDSRYEPTATSVCVYSFDTAAYVS